MNLLDVAAGGTPLAGAAVYVWHCDRDGRYSLYDPAIASENYLRGVQESDKTLAIPKEACDAVYASSGYEQSVQNLGQTSLDGDMVFSDGYASQLAAWSGSATDGIALKLNVGV
jgi:hypothetical protein